MAEFLGLEWEGWPTARYYDAAITAELLLRASSARSRDALRWTWARGGWTMVAGTLQRVNVRELRRGLKSYLATVSVP